MHTWHRKLTYKKELFLKSPAELQALVEEEREIQEREQRFYNQPNADADFVFWSQMPCWVTTHPLRLNDSVVRH